MPTIATIQSRLRTLADQHGRDLSALCERADTTANALYRHLPSTAKGEALFRQLRKSLASIVEQARTDARDLAAAHMLADLRAVIGKKVEKLSIPMGEDPDSADMAEYIDNAVTAAREAMAGAEDKAEAFASTAYRAHTILESEATNQYRLGRETANKWLRDMPAEEAKKHGFVVAKKEDDFRSATSEVRADTKWLPIIGERWNASANACEKCRGADGEMRPFGFAFSLAGPAAHARCQCVRTLWALAIPIEGEEEGRSTDEQSTESSHCGCDRTSEAEGTRIEESAMGEPNGHPNYSGLLRTYTPEEERATTTVNEEARTVEVIASTEALDSYGTRLLSEGWDLKRYTRNPIFLLCHNSRDIKAVAGTAEAWLDGKKLRALLKFLPAGKNADVDLCFDLYKTKVLRGVSVGFQPREWEDIEIETEKGSMRYQRIFKRQELVEISAVPVPANPEALARELRDFGRSDELPMNRREVLVSDENSLAAAPPIEQGTSNMDNVQALGATLTDQVASQDLPQELATCLGVSTVADAVKEVSKRDLQMGELTRQLEASKADTDAKLAEANAKVEAAEKRAVEAEKRLSDRIESDVRALVESGRIQKDKEASAMTLAKSDYAAFRNLFPAESVAPMAHLLRQVVQPEPPTQATPPMQEAGKHHNTSNPIVAEKERIQKEAAARGEPMTDAEAFNRAYANVTAKLASKPAAHLV